MKNTFIFMLFLLPIVAFGQQQVPNGSFENWSGDPLAPDGWLTVNSITPDYPTYGTTRITDSYDGTYAVKLVSGKVDATPMGFPYIDTTAVVSIGVLTSQGPIYGIPFTDRPLKLSFYYKYSPGTYPTGIVDTAQVLVQLRSQNSSIGEGVMKFYGNAVTQYTYAEIPITYWNQATPDTLVIDITSSVTGFSKCDVCHFANQIGSELIIDKMEFIYTTTGINNAEQIQNFVTIYPNPASDKINLDINNTTLTELATVNIYSTTGKLIKGLTISQNHQQIDIRNLSNGIYILEVKSNEWTNKQRLIIQR
ncbi:MAG TPA: T9SS type A sorting domain-containing protein [Bacteroidales bacterium]|jgi:hypothetical protein|nr:T9SS type A sorting domain-containing protein [Bacteroidales bacterium]HRT00090.1 T9SS type A sorting domain-containing protein [Bacteroidales bacterium]